MEDTRGSNCPILFALDIFGDKWSLLIMRDILIRGGKYYKDFLDAGEGISTNILADRLEQLESHGLITKQRDESNKRRFIYSPTQKGLELVPTLMELIDWSAKHDPDTGTPQWYIERLKTNRDDMIQEIYGQFKSVNLNDSE
jgi:DNA-binding HxlR family transcriptional regulator